MDFKELDSINRATLQAIERSHASGGRIPLPEEPYYGFVEVDLFECPKFLMFTNGDAPTVKYILYHRKFEPTSMRLWCRLCATATGVIDGGANVGVYSLSAASLRPDLGIYAFEPNPYAFSRLRMHKEINRFHNISENPVALGQQAQLLKLQWVKKPGGIIASGAGLGSNSMYSETEDIPVRVMRLDDTGIAAALGPKPLVKIDVEGGELQALSGMMEVLKLKPDIILETFLPEVCEFLNQLLTPMGYSYYLIRENEGRLEPRERLSPLDFANENFNQFLTTRPRNEIESLMGR